MNRKIKQRQQQQAAPKVRDDDGGEEDELDELAAGKHTYPSSCLQQGETKHSGAIVSLNRTPGPLPRNRSSSNVTST